MAKKKQQNEDTEKTIKVVMILNCKCNHVRYVKDQEYEVDENTYEIFKKIGVIS